MDDWDDIVRDTGEDHDTDAHDVSDEDTTRNNIMKSEESADQANKSDTEQVDHHASPDDEQQCRICFGGVEDEEELGRLISPCQCRGSMSKVHINCLNRWRNASSGRKSFYQCDQCGYRYRIQRAKIAGLAENKFALASLAMSFFFAIVIINGLLGNWLLNKARSEDSILGAVFFDGPSYEDYGYSSFSYRDSYLPLEAVGQAVDLAQKVVSEGLSGSSSLHSHNSKSKTKKRIQDHKMEMVRVEYTDEDGQTAYRMVRRRIQTRRPFLSKLVNWTKDVASFLAVGISMTGIGSFFWLVLTLPLWPLHPFRNGLFRSLRSTRDSRGGLSPIGTVFVVMFVIIGLIKSVHMCWKLANRTAKAILKRAETGILEVGA